MSTPGFPAWRVFCASVVCLIFALEGGRCIASPVQQEDATSTVTVDCRDIDGTKFVAARVVIDETPQNVWRTLANPFEFEKRICKRMKRVSVLADTPDVSILDCTVGVVFPVPDFRYIVESHYVPCSRVDFHRISGSFKDFRGFWMLEPVENGTKTEVTYSIFIDPGFPAPDWLVREAVKHELPNVLTGLRERVAVIKANADAAETRTIQGACAMAPETKPGDASVAPTRAALLVPQR